VSRPAGSPPPVASVAPCGCPQLDPGVRVTDPARHAAWHELAAEQAARPKPPPPAAPPGDLDDRRLRYMALKRDAIRRGAFAEDPRPRRGYR
jgi:hypothetical protein